MRIIDILLIGRTGPVPWPIRLPRPKRQPADGAGTAGEPCCDPNTDPDAQERHQGRGIDRWRVNRTTRDGIAAGGPAPAPAILEPSPVMERCEAPGRRVDPGPAPGGDIAPVPVPIRHPARRHLRIPDLAVIRVGFPGTVLHQIGAAGHLGHHGRRHHRLPVPRLGRGYPGLERVRPGLLHAHGEIVIAGDHDRLPGQHLQRRTPLADLRRALIDNDLRRPRGIADHDLVTARRGDGYQRARGPYPIALARSQGGRAQIDVALPQRRRHLAGVQPVYLQLAAAIQQNAPAGQFQLRRRPRLGPKPAAGCDRPVHLRPVPLIGVGGMKRNRAGHARHPAHPRRGIDLHGSGSGGRFRPRWHQRRHQRRRRFRT